VAITAAVADYRKEVFAAEKIENAVKSQNSILTDSFVE
jgi:hypothetical protein